MSRIVPIELHLVAEDDDLAVQAVHDIRVAAARDLTQRFGKGPWTSEGTTRGVVADIRGARVYLGALDGEPVATARLATRKPWAIDVSYFTPVKRALYLTSMAVHPRAQRRGVGRALLALLAREAREWPAESIRLDAYDADAGAGGFYERCGYSNRGQREYRGTPLKYYELAL